MTMLATTLLGNSQRLDGGAMFGNAPRALWSRWLPPDEQSRVPLACRVLLIEAPHRRILFETGIGNFFDPALRERYGVVEENHVLLESIAAIGLGYGDIDCVVLSHLHFDHAGGLLAPYRSGRPAELLFRRAEVVVSRRAFERAKNPHPRDRASFIPELPGLLEASGRLHVVDGAQGARAALGDGFDFVESEGHTPGLLLGMARGKNHRVLFCSDLIPGTAWLHAPITMGYDRHAEQLVDEKTELLTQCATFGAELVYTHDPVVAASRVLRDGRGRFSASEAVPALTRWDLDAPEPALPA
jgi:glyoxylase-like metal-dependent hydrolase (beta-lactamase superfamily II)